MKRGAITAQEARRLLRKAETLWSKASRLADELDAWVEASIITEEQLPALAERLKRLEAMVEAAKEAVSNCTLCGGEGQYALAVDDSYVQQECEACLPLRLALDALEEVNP